MSTPDKNIKKITIKQADLPSISNTGNYYITYRIVDADGSQVSAWSPKYIISGSSVGRSTSYKAIDTDISSNGQSITCIWTVPPEIDGRKFDVWVRWSHETDQDTDFSNWIYSSTTSDKVANIPIESSTITRTANISSASGSGTTTYNTSSPHGYKKGNLVTVTGMTPSQYNISNKTITEVGSTYFKVSGVSVPGPATGFGVSSAVSINEQAKYVQVLIQLETTPRVALPGSDLEVSLTPATKTAVILDGGTP